MKKILRILGIRGIPAQHGGFETFAEYLSIYLVKHGWDVTVYCQEVGLGEIYYDEWKGVHRVHIPVMQKGAKSTVIFDWKSTMHAAKSTGLILTLGYNTAVFCIIYRLKKIKNIINMDGIEWKREKWSFFERAWLFFNEYAGCLFGDQLVADHPEIKLHLAKRVNERKITMIPYGSEEINSADVEIIRSFGLAPKSYAIIIARPEPENSILEIVTAFSNKKRNKMLVVLGDYDKSNSNYCKKVKEAASKEVVFPGAIYDKNKVRALRFYESLYINGHQVGGTNPSLVESLGAKNPVLAHDNKYNRWVAGNINRYFSSVKECDSFLSDLLDNKEQLSVMSKSSQKQHHDLFTFGSILDGYEKVLTQYI
jgi:glycosyltransferase involved in cell wall biosynthesis